MSIRLALTPKSRRDNILSLRTMKFRVKLYGIARRLLPLPVVRRIGKHYLRFSSRMKYRDADFPRCIYIEITTHCNRRCDYCPQSTHPLEARRIDHDLYLKCLERVREIKWTGPLGFSFYNEPLLEKELESLIRLAIKECPGVLPSIISNGDLLTEEKMLGLVDAGVVNFTITRHPPYSEEWDERLTRLAKKYPQYIALDCIENTPLHNRAGLVELSPAQDKVDMTNGCTTWREGGLVIDIDGKYLFCCCDYNRHESMGNIQDSPILEAWNNETYREARKSVASGKPILPICKACFKK